MKTELVKLCIDTYRNSVQNFSKSQANDVIRNAFVEIIGTDKPTYKEFRRHKVEVFEIMEEVLDQLITDGFANNSFFDQFVEYRDLNLGDSQEFYIEDRSTLVVSRHSGGNWNIRRQRLDVGSTISVESESYAVAVYDYFKRFLAGRINWDALITKVAEGVTNEINSRIYTNFMSTMTYLPAEFKETGAFVEGTMMDIVEHVQASNNNSPVLIAGTRKALSKITGSVQSHLVSENMKNQVNQTGLMQDWNGIPLLPIPQVHTSGTFSFQIDNDRLMILPSNIKPIKVIREGESMMKEVSDGLTNQDMSMEHKFITNFGVATIFNQLYGMYQLV